MSLTKISIITINRNNGLGLETTIQSVVEQHYQNVEYIIIDGGSTDNSIAVIKQNESKLHYWISEKDNGVYHAMNKGIAKATGDYLLFLNSGDYLHSPDSLHCLLDEDTGEDLIYGNIQVQETTKSWVKEYPSTLTFSYFLRDTLPHPATLIKRSLLFGVGFNENFKIVSDWEFFVISICKIGATYKHIDKTISVFNYEGISSNPANASLIRDEKNKTLEDHFKSFVQDYQSYFELQQAYELLVKSRPHRAISKLKRIPFVSAFFKS
jgi:glycosyltransferase involved in cell wall biosynthesis